MSIFDEYDMKKLELLKAVVGSKIQAIIEHVKLKSKLKNYFERAPNRALKSHFNSNIASLIFVLNICPRDCLSLCDRLVFCCKLVELANGANSRQF